MKGLGEGKKRDRGLKKKKIEKKAIFKSLNSPGRGNVWSCRWLSLCGGESTTVAMFKPWIFVVFNGKIHVDFIFVFTVFAAKGR